MSGFNAKRIGNYGQTNYVVGLGRNRCAVGSISREYNYLERTTKAPFCALFDFACPNNPTPPPGPTVPSVPIIVTATPFETSIDIYFTQSSNGGSPITNYEYLFFDVSGSMFIPFSPPVTTSPVTVTGLNSGQTYYIKIRAINAVGAGPASNTVIETTLTVPEEPTNLSAIPGDTSIEINFTEPVDGGSPITNYEYSLDGGSSWSPFSPSYTGSPVTINALNNGTVYDIKLRAVNAVGAGVPSSQISIAPIPSNSFDPADISGINLWLDGQYPSSVIIADNLVTTWDDRSGANNNFVSGPSGTITYSKPSGINNRPAIYFQTAPSTYLSRSFNISPSTNELSLFMIVYPVSNVTGNSELFFASGAPTSPSWAYFDLFNNTNTTGLLSINIGNQTQVSTGIDIRGNITLIDVIATATADIYVNGTQTNNNIARGLLSLDNIIEWSVSGGAFQGYVGEIVTYPSGLSDSNRQQVEGYLAWKWGLQANLPNTQPYKTAPPISLDAPVITGITGLSQSVSVDFTQTTGGLTITNYQYSTDNGETFRPLSTPNITSPLTITTLSSDGTTPLTNGVTYEIIIQAKTANGLSPLSNMVQGTPEQQPIIELFTTVGSTTWTAPANVTSIEYLVVGGGGGSGATHDGGAAGGGGGGMVLSGSKNVIPGTTYTLVIGDGGEGGIGLPSPNTRETDGSAGENSQFDDIIALGGGGGLKSRQVGNGGGGTGALNPLTASLGGNGGSFSNGGGGGGGSSSNGSTGDQGIPRIGGIGGNGISSSLSGALLNYGVGGTGGDAQATDNASAGATNTGNGAKAPGTPFGSQRSGAKGGSGIVVIKYIPNPPDAIADSLTTSLAAYQSAANDDWVKITSTEYSNLQTNISGTTKAGANDTLLNASSSGGLANNKAALVANSVTINSPAIPANHYLYAFAIRWTTNVTSENMCVFTNTNSATTTGFNQVGSTLPPTTSSGIAYYVRKGVSSTNGSTAGLLACFSGTKMDYPNPNFTGSAGYIGFTTSISPFPSMRYLLNDGTIPASNSTLTGNLSGYGAFVLQGLTTDTKQWS